MADQRPDAVLWAALMAGDQFAFDGIYDRHVAAVYRVAARRVGVEHAEDLTSAVFTEMWTHRQRIRLADPGGLGPWLMGTTINLARRHHERTAAGTRMIGRVATGVSHEPDHADQVIDDLADAADLALAQQVLAELPEADQEVLVLCVLEGMTPTQAGEVLGQGASTVRSRLTRSRRRLADAFQQRRHDHRGQAHR